MKLDRDALAKSCASPRAKCPTWRKAHKRRSAWDETQAENDQCARAAIRNVTN
jgi:hypothetical protein